VFFCTSGKDRGVVTICLVVVGVVRISAAVWTSAGVISPVIVTGFSLTVLEVQPEKKVSRIRATINR
jgi:hypothetical protein